MRVWLNTKREHEPLRTALDVSLSERIIIVYLPESLGLAKQIHDRLRFDGEYEVMLDYVPRGG